MKKRVISAAIAIAIVIPLYIIGGIPFAVAVGVIAALALKEIIDLNEKTNPYPNGIKVLAFLILELIVLGRIESQFILYGLPYLGISLLIILLLIPTIFDKTGKYTSKDAFALIGAIVFLGTFFNILIMTFNSSKTLLLYLILIATMTDTFAYIIGTLIGKHKLMPSVSPKKSIEGSVFGTLVAVIISSIYYYNIVTSNINIFILILMSLVLSILGQLGDLLFSKIKRENNIKDFSNIMPGHGGILDRLDSMTFILLGYIIVISILNLF